MFSTRPYLCPQAQEGANLETWEASADNAWWRPNQTIYPSTDLLLPGDVVLFAPQHPSVVEKGIQRWQKSRGATQEAAQFTHAALYVGLDHIICEATPRSGVMYSVLGSRLDRYCVLARRWPGLPLSSRQKILAVAAERYLGKPYNYLSALAETVRKGSGDQWEQEEQGLVCSRLCDRSITLALIQEVAGDQLRLAEGNQWVTPAVLSETNKLVDVDLGWRRVG